MSRTRILDRRALFSSAAAATLLAATGVSASGPERGGRLRMALSGASRADTWLAGDGLFMQIARQGLVFDTLTEVAADGVLRGELATSWSASPDARAWRFDLRQGVRFHDGAPFTAQDVVASAQGFAGGDVSAAGPYEVRFHLETPDPVLPLRLSEPEYFISAQHALGEGVGTGLYRVTDFRAGQRLLTERVDKHYKDGTAGWFDQVELTSIPAERVRAQALAEYLVDAVDVTAMKDRPDLTDFACQPDADNPVQAVSTGVKQPVRLGFQRPLDNLRAAERWWFA
ncbi:MAG: ABC transporter substrate-binding protein [Pseudomonadota bacterium]